MNSRISIWKRCRASSHRKNRNATNEKYSKNFDLIPETPIVKEKSFNPKMNLKWNVGEFKYQIKRAHSQHKYA